MDNGFYGKKILITGAGGSIGSGLVYKLIENNYKNLILLDHSEYLLFSLIHKLDFRYKYYLADIRDAERIQEILEKERPHIIFHTAALKHVPLLEEHPVEAIKTNILGTWNLVRLATEYHVEKFIFISSDKAIRPASIMGATKRVGEMICQFYNHNTKTIMTSVRFGNVLGSSGSVIPIFREQIEKGGPVTVTDPRMERYFMSIDQACELLITIMNIMTPSDDVFFLHLGEPINIYELAKFMILSFGKMPDKDIPILITGLRKGEKLYEEFYEDDECIRATPYEGIKKVILNGIPENFLEILNALVKEKDITKIQNYLKQLVPDYRMNVSSK